MSSIESVLKDLPSMSIARGLPVLQAQLEALGLQKYNYPMPEARGWDDEKIITEISKIAGPLLDLELTWLSRESKPQSNQYYNKMRDILDKYSNEDEARHALQIGTCPCYLMELFRNHKSHVKAL